MPKTLYLVRHGRTMFNEKGRIQGWCDSPLSELGRRQADGAGAVLRRRGVAFDYICCSDAGRAVETLEHIMGKPFDEIEFDRLKGLRETYYGKLEGESTYLIDGKVSFEDRVRIIQAANGESYDHLRERVVETLTDVMEAPGRTCVLAVTHADVMRRFYEAWEDRSPVRYSEPMQNCCTFVYEYEDGAFRLKEALNQDFSAEADRQ